MKKIKINASSSYDIVIAENYDLLLDNIKKTVKGKIMVVYDKNTYIIFSERVKGQLSEYKIVEEILPVGENTKSIDYFLLLTESLVKNGFNRSDCIISVGGGVVGDLCGFVASTYMRGIDYIACPTTLLACMDSSVGGKTAINLPYGKNLIGSFYQPKLVYISLTAIQTLPDREIECGIGEIIKYAFLDKKITEQDVRKKDFASLIEKCVEIKKSIVEQDEYDLSLRAKLNLGHTVGHAIESLSEYKYSHGLCVLNGIRKIIDLSCKYYGYGEEKRKEFFDLLYSFPHEEISDFALEEILDKIKVDKKCGDGYVNLALIKDIGKVEIVKFTFVDLENFLK